MKYILIVLMIFMSACGGATNLDDSDPDWDLDFVKQDAPLYGNFVKARALNEKEFELYLLIKTCLQEYYNLPDIPERELYLAFYDPHPDCGLACNGDFYLLVPIAYDRNEVYVTVPVAWFLSDKAETLMHEIKHALIWWFNVNKIPIDNGSQIHCGEEGQNDALCFDVCQEEFLNL
jgi:hypothetical protein